jgi:hypothetical protein
MLVYLKSKFEWGVGEDLSEVDPRQSLFDGRVSASPALNLSRMQSAYSFFVPDSEYLVNLEGFLGYCNEKVWWGNTCLYCHRNLASVEGLKHMHNKRHCKILYKRAWTWRSMKSFTTSGGWRAGAVTTSAAVAARRRRRPRSVSSSTMRQWRSSGRSMRSRGGDEEEWENVSDDNDSSMNDLEEEQEEQEEQEEEDNE